MSSRVRAPLSAGTLCILRAALVAIRPRGHGFDQPIDDDVLAAVTEFFPYLPVSMRLGLPVGLRLLQLAPPVVIGRFRRFTQLPMPEARAVLDRVHRLGGPFAPLVLGLRALVLIHFYEHPAVRAALGIDWAGRAAIVTTRRATLLADAAS